MNNAEIIKTIFLAVEPKVAWDYLTQPDKLALWFHPPKVPLELGKDYALYGAQSGNKACWGTVVEMTPHSHLKYTFSITPAPDLVMEVEWHLVPVAGGTRITLHHTGLEKLGDAGLPLIQGLDKGWDEHFASLRAAA